MKPAIVIVAFNRPESLKRLLLSVQNGQYSYDDIDLVISIDYQNSENRKEVVDVANAFLWNYGNKLIINHSENLGLRKHVLSCGDLTSKYNSIILLEDDLVVSGQFYKYAKEALKFYHDDDRVGGISLYNHRKNPFNRLHFETIPEDSDTYFLQFASSWGQAWTFKQWKEFRDWYQYADISNDDPIPENVKRWPDSSWLKFFVKYLVIKDKYFVYPNKSFSTNFSDSGTHNKSKNTDFQVPLYLGEINSFRFQEIEKSINIYDAFFELIPSVLKKLDKNFQDLDVTVDLYGMKSLSMVKTKYLLSSKRLKDTNDQYMAGYSLQMKPPIINVIYNLKGGDIGLGETALFENNFEGLDIADNSVWDYYVFKLKPNVYLKIFANKVFLKLRKKQVKLT
uniref:Glycosyl transferase family 2 n=1 Tax=Sphingobacterium sp. (strain 21) TaxID=743722 RepID=F4CA80_SPHS2